MSHFLKILSAPDKKLVGGKLDLPEGETLVGRVSPPANIKLEGVKVSKKHCLFKVTGPEVKISDLRSSNGVFVNGKRVESAVLKEKDRMVIGEYVLELVKAEEMGFKEKNAALLKEKEKTNAKGVKGDK